MGNELDYKNELTRDEIDQLHVHWEAENVFPGLSPVQQGIVPFQVIGHEVRLRKVLEEEIEGMNRGGFCFSSEQIGTALDNGRERLARGFPAFREINQGVAAAHAPALQRRRELYRIASQDFDTVPDNVTDSEFDAVVNGFRTYLFDFLGQIEAKLGITALMPKLRTIIR
ncbi:hypothetical protein KBD59_04150 [Candidatus Gracilibacteria bacterium]|nr:hypothetical protein [Candidatus Gracilibacteria bacterium]